MLTPEEIGYYNSIDDSNYPYVTLCVKAPEALLQRWQKLVEEHDREKAIPAIEKATKEKEKQEQDALIADEKQRRQKDEPPPEGWKRKDNFLISLKPASIFGVPYYQMVEIFPTLYDRETIKIPENPISFFQSFTNFSNPTQK